MFNLSWLLGKYSSHIQAEFIDDYLYIQDTLGVVFVRRASIFLTIAFFLMVAAVYDEWDTGFLYIACFILFCFVLSVLSLFYVKELKLHKNYVRRTSSFIFWSKTHEIKLAGNQIFLICAGNSTVGGSGGQTGTFFHLSLQTMAPRFEEVDVQATMYRVHYNKEPDEVIIEFFIACKNLAEFMGKELQISQKLLQYNKTEELLNKAFGDEVVYAKYS